MSNYPKFTQGWNFTLSFTTTKVQLTPFEETESTFPVFIPLKTFPKTRIGSIAVFNARNFFWMCDVKGKRYLNHRLRPSALYHFRLSHKIAPNFELCRVAQIFFQII